jgi:hypothetical protein
MGETVSAYKVLVGKCEGRTQLQRARRRWEDNAKMDLKGIEWKSVDWIRLAQDRG